MYILKKLTDLNLYPYKISDNEYKLLPDTIKAHYRIYTVEDQDIDDGFYIPAPEIYD